MPAGLSDTALAVRPEPQHRSDARRFGLDRKPQAQPAAALDAVRKSAALRRFNQTSRRSARLSFGPAGVSAPAAGAARRATEDVVRDFLRQHGAELGLQADELRLNLARTSRGFHHLLFEQVVAGVPVEFASLKVHLSEDGEIINLQSSIRADLPASPVPQVAQAAAAATVAADLEGRTPDGGTLVFFPPRDGSAVRLAWKFRVSGRGGNWLYYVDAHSGALLFRYNDLRYALVCQSSGTVRGEVFDLDPNTPPGLVTRPIRHQKVYVVNASTFVRTNDDGFFCSGTPGRIFTTLQGPYAHVANFKGPNVHYQNGNGTWNTPGTPLSSPHPYASNTLTISTITLPSAAVLSMPHFSTFKVGSFDAVLGDIFDNDQVAILDADGNPVATYIGSLGAFMGTTVPGNRYNIRLKSDESGVANGFDIDISSYLTLDNSVVSTPDNATASFTWTTAHAIDGSRDEVNLFYQVNLMHDYFRTRVSSGVNSAFIDVPLPVMARMGPNLANAFYDPVHKNLAFGDVGNGFALDATVVRHEYVHFVIDRIYPIINFGQNGAISEGLADYFAGSSLEISAIGGYTQASLGGHGAFRELNCTSGQACYRTFPTNWTGLIHDDSLMVSQALWDLRKDLVSNPPAPGPALDCADTLVYEALFFFPDSFSEMLNALIEVSDRSQTLAPACGPNSSVRSRIIAHFAAHGISQTPSDQDIYEPNDGVQTATDISTAAVIRARIYSIGDLDYYAIGAGPGRLNVTLNLPANPAGAGSYLAYSMNLVDKDHEVVATVNPPMDVNPTFSGFCPEPPGLDCLTSAPSITLTYDNPASNQFYLIVSAPPSDGGFVSRNNSAQFYELTADFNRTGPVASSIVNATFDNDLIDFAVTVSSFVTKQNYIFHHAQLRDHTLTVLDRTRSDGAAPYLTMLSSVSAFGTVSGQLRLQSGFDQRFPAVGSVHVEIFGENLLGHVQSLGFSPALHLTAQKSSIKAWNNVFTPANGGKTTIKYEISSAGRVRVRLFTIDGRHVLTLMDEEQPAGKGALDWSGVNRAGSTVASGIYLLNIEAPGISETKKIVVVK